MKFVVDVCIHELLERTISVEVDAPTEDDAELMAESHVRDEYENEKIVLDSSDHVDTDYCILSCIKVREDW